MNLNINKEILTEIKRISELMSINEGIDDVFKLITREQIKEIISKDISAIIKAAIEEEGYAAIKSSIVDGTRKLPIPINKFKDIYDKAAANIKRDLTWSEKANIRTEVGKMVRDESLNVLKKEKNSLTKLATKTSALVGDVMSRIKTLFGDRKNLIPTSPKTPEIEQQLSRITDAQKQQLIDGVTKKGWTKGNIVKWSAGIFLSYQALLWFLQDEQEDDEIKFWENKFNCVFANSINVDRNIYMDRNNYRYIKIKSKDNQYHLFSDGRLKEMDGTVKPKKLVCKDTKITFGESVVRKKLYEEDDWDKDIKKPTNTQSPDNVQTPTKLPTWTNNYPCLLNSKLGKPVKTKLDNQVVINFSNGNKLYFWEKICSYIFKNGEQYMGKWSCKDGKIYIIYDNGRVFDGDKIVSAKDDAKQPLKPALDSTQKPASNSSQLPPELKDVKDFQDWLDINAKEWATGYKDGKLSQGAKNPGFKSGGYGKFGPRTQKAWSTYKDQYLKDKGIKGAGDVTTTNQNLTGYEDYKTDEVETSVESTQANDDKVEQ